MTSMVESDIDKFIQNQKAKLQQERQQLADDERGERVGRRQWDSPGRGQAQYAEQTVNVLRSPDLRIPLSTHSSDTQTRDLDSRNKKQTSAYSNSADKKYDQAPKDTNPNQNDQIPSPETGLDKLGDYEKTRQKLKEERVEEYKALQSQQLPKKTIMVRDYSMGDPNILTELDYKEAKLDLMHERRREYESYLLTHHPDLLPLLSRPAYHTSRPQRHYVRRSPSLHGPMLRHFSFEQFLDQRDENAKGSPRKPEIDYKEWERTFQNEKKKDYNEYLEQQKHRSRKLPTPPGSGMKFGEFEEYRKKIDRQRKQEYKEELEKQQEEQMLLKAQRDYNNVPFIQVSPRLDPNKEKLDHEISNKIMEQKFQEFNKMMAINKKHDQERREVNGLRADHQRRDRELKDIESQYPKNYRDDQTQYEMTSEPNHYNDTYSYQKYQQQLKEERERESRQFDEQRSEPQKSEPKTNRKNQNPEEETGFQFGKYEEKRKHLDAERKKEYNELLAKQALKGKRSKAAQLREDRSQTEVQPQRIERSNAPAQSQVEERPYAQYQPERSRRQASPPSHSRGDETTRLLEEKEREYYDLVSKLQHGREDNSTERQRNDQGTPTRFPDTDKAAITMLEEKEREYQQLLKERHELERETYRDQLPPKPPTPGGMFNKLGAHDREREKLNEERKEEYNRLINEQAESFYEVANTYRSMMSDELDYEHNSALESLIEGVRKDQDASSKGDRRGRAREPQRETYVPEARPRPRPSSEESPGASLKGLNPRDSAEIRKKQVRNDEYNEYLQQKGGKGGGRPVEGRPPLPNSAKNPRHRYKDTDPFYRRVNSASSQREIQKNEEIYATLPGLHYSDSADKRKMAQRNKEYNEMLQRGGKRSSRSDEPPGPRKGWQSPFYDEILDRKRQQEAQYRREDPGFPGMRSYNSEGAIDTLGNDRYKELDREYETRKVRFRDQRSNILDDDQWLDADQVRKDAEYRDLQQPPPAPRAPPKEEPPQAEMATSYFATLPVGGNERDSAKRRRQNKYRDELQLQMQEAVAAKRREKVEDLKVNASGFLDPEKTSRRIANLGNPDITPRRNVRSPEVQPYHTKFDLSPRSNGRGADLNADLGVGGFQSDRGRRRERGGGVGGSGGLLDTGFEGLLEGRPRGGGYIPPGIQYQPSFADPTESGRYGIPSTYITGGGGLGNPALSSIDEAYHFYGMRNPLEPEGSADKGGLDIPLNRLDDAGYRDRMSPPRVTFEDNARSRSKSRERISPYQFPSDDDFRSKSRQGQNEYKRELERQIQEKKYRDQKAKEEKERYDKKLEEEIRNYNPFGRGGGGAPIKDNQGNAVTDLRSMHYGNVDGPYSSRSPPPRESPRFRPPGSPKDDLIRPPPVQQNAKGESTYARGGHGIFGQPRTDAEKTNADKYKDDLRRQIEDKKRQEQIEREKEKIEEEKENRRLEEQRIRIQKEYEEETRKKREKEEEARKRNEEMRLEAEERKKAEKRKRAEDAEAKTRERQRQQEEEQADRQREARGGSPPIPALKSKLATENGEPSESAEFDKQNYKPPKSKDPQKRENFNGEDVRLSPLKPTYNMPGYDHFRTSSVSLGPPTPQSVKSPVIRTPTSDGRGKSPPVPSHRSKPDEPKAGPAPTPLARANSSDVLKELATMRKQLQSERKRVENALENQKNEPDVFDPRMVQRPPPREIDVFERAKQGHAAVPQRTSDTANARTLQDFNELKYKNDTDSRRAFRSMFPDAPTSNSALETQQDALLRHQEDTLKNLSNKKERQPTPGTSSANSSKIDYGNGRQSTLSPKSMLNSNSAFIDVDGVNHFPEDFEDLPKRNESARLRRRERIPVSPRPESHPLNPMGSTTSLDVDRIQKKNDARLRRLHQMNTDDVSIADPDDILDRFMAKQRYNRPPSGQTLQDDSWLRPGSKAF